MVSADQEQANPHKEISHGGYAISQPQEYSTDEILCKLHTPSCSEGAQVFLSSCDMRFASDRETHASIFKDHDLLDRLIEACHSAEEEVSQASTFRP